MGKQVLDKAKLDAPTKLNHSDLEESRIKQPISNANNLTAPNDINQIDENKKMPFPDNVAPAKAYESEKRSN